MAQYTCNANMAAYLLPMLVKRRASFSLVWPLIDMAIFEGDPRMIELIKAEAVHLNMQAKGVSLAPIEQWGYWDDMTFPLTSPVDLREGFEPASNLNDWEDATHQITFDGGKHWTNVTLTDGVYLACSDGKRFWETRGFRAGSVVKRPENYQHTVTGRISDPQPQQIERVYGGARGGGKRYAPESKPFTGFPPAELIDPEPFHLRTSDGDFTVTPPRIEDGQVISGTIVKRQPATVGEQASCGFLDTEFDSDPSVVGE